MKNLKKYILITSSVFIVLFLFVFFTGMGESSVNIELLNTDDNQELSITSENPSSISEDTGSESGTMPYTFEEWRIFLLELNNATIEDLDSFSSESLYYLNEQAWIYAGWSNGTYSDEERDQLFDTLHSSPLIGTPTFNRNDDDRFEATFSITVIPLAMEHCFRIYCYLDYYRGDTNIYGGNKFHDESYIKGPYPGSWPGYLTWDRYPYDNLPFISDLNPYEGFLGSHYVRGTKEGQQILPIDWYTFGMNDPFDGTLYSPPREIYFVIQMLYRYDTMTTGINYQCIFKWVTKIYSVTLYDDDTTGPILPVENVVTTIDPINSPSYIYDGDVSFDIEVLGYDIESDLGNRIAFDGQEVSNGIYIGDVLIEFGGLFGQDLYAYWYKYTINNNFGYTPGYKTVDLMVWNNDDDGWTGDPDATTEQVSFWVLDDDTFAPEVVFFNDWEIYDSEANLEIILQATDASGISSIVVQFGGIDYLPYYDGPGGEYRIRIPNPKTPGLYWFDIFVRDGDNDGWNGDTLQYVNAISFNVIDDDITPPNVNFINDWEIYDSEDYFEIIIDATDLDSGIYSPGVYADFGSGKGGPTRYYGVLETDGFYHIYIDNPRTPKSYNVEIWVFNNDYDNWNGDRDDFHDILTFNVVDDDESPPIVNFHNNWFMLDCDGYFEIILDASDIESGIHTVWATILIEGPFGILVTKEFMGYYDELDGFYHILVYPQIFDPGVYDIKVYVLNNDNDGWSGDRECFESPEVYTIEDDDIDPPIIDIQYIEGDMTDGNPGKWMVNVYDPSGLYEVTIYIDGVLFETIHKFSEGSFSKTYNILNSLGSHSIQVFAKDNDNDRAGDKILGDDLESIIIGDDDTSPPEFDLISTMEWSGTEILYRFMIDATDESGIASISIEINGMLITGPGWHDLILPSGIYTVYVSVTDGDDDRAGENDSETNEEFYTVIIDLTPPTTEINCDIFYSDGETIYVVSETVFSLSATDDVSGVAEIFYSINGDTWITYTGPFSLEGLDGPYIIEFYSVDNVGNIEPINILNVQLISLDVSSYISRGQSEAIEYFDVIFRKCKQDGVDGYMLVATNPGEIFYNIEFTNVWPILIDMLYIDVSLPTDFVTKGANPFHIFLDGFEITNLCIIEGNVITISNIAPGSMVRIVVHVDYGLKGTFYDALDEFWMEHYTFFTEVQANSDSLAGTYSSSTEFKAFEKKETAIAGFVKDEFDNPIAYATVELLLEDGTILTALTDSEGFYYFLELPVGIHQIRVFDLTDWQVIETWKNEVTWMDFIIP
ncbi:MAG: carboxypeptidase-like regulatory domain-containing protein [Promethearchaeota archaeon]